MLSKAIKIRVHESSFKTLIADKKEGADVRGGSRRDVVAIAKALRMSLNLRTVESSHGISGWGATAIAKLKCFDRGEVITTAVYVRDPSEIW